MQYLVTRKYRQWSLGVLLCLIAAFAGTVGATASILVAPIDPKLSAQDHSVALWLENRDSKPVSLQIRVLGWVQSDHADGYTAQDLIVASPPVATIEPGKRQMVRLIRMQPAPSGTEQAYRVLVDEIPVGGDSAASDAGDMGIKFQMRYSVPLFVYGEGLWVHDPALKDGPGEAAVPVLDVRTMDEDGRRYLVVRNTGPVHARLAQVQLIDAAGSAHEMAGGLLGYVLSGAVMRWPLPAQLPQDDFRVEMKVNDEPELWTLPVRH